MSKISLAEKESKEKSYEDAFVHFEKIWDGCQTYSEDEDKPLLEEYLSIDFPDDFKIRYLLTKARDIERDSRF